MAVCYNANRHINSFCLRLIRYFRRFSVIFIHDSRHGGTSETIGSLPISWKSHPSMVLIEPPPLLESVAGRKYHYPPAFPCRSGKLFRILKVHICRSLFQGLGVWLLWLPRFYTDRVINVLAELIFYCQVTWSFYSPYTCIGVEVWYLTTVFYCDLKSLLSLHKILRFFL